MATCPATESDCVMLPVIQDLSARVEGIEKAQSQEGEKTRAIVSGVSTKVDRVDAKLDRVIEGLRIGAIVPAPVERKEHGNGNGKHPPPSNQRRESLISWSTDEDTGLHAAPTWASRARDTVSLLEAVDGERERLAIENAALKARMSEREKQNGIAREDKQRSSDMTLKKWQIIAGLVTTILGSGLITALISYLATGHP